MIALRTPYLLFLGDVDAEPIAKTAIGIRDWVPELCVGQHRLTRDALDLGLPDLSPADAAARGAGSLVIGAAPVGGALPSSWWPALHAAADAGLDVVSGLHAPLAEVPGLAERARARGVSLRDVRTAPRPTPIATGAKRPGKRLLTVGTDCALGKKYTALALARALRERGVDADFRATGQTGIMIAGAGVAIDSVVADFVAGAAEQVSPAAAPTHWDVIEGQGSLFHPAYAGVTLGLLHGSQPDAMVLCHDPTRRHLHSFPGYPLPALDDAAARYVEAARLTNPAARLAGISLNTSRLSPEARARTLAETENRMGLPCVDPLASPLDRLVDAVLAA